MNPPVIIDTNILFAALVSSRSRIREILFTGNGFNFSCPRFLFVELFKHKERIQAATELSEEELLDALNALLARVHFVDESTIPVGTWLEARRLCSGVDERHTVHRFDDPSERAALDRRSGTKDWITRKKF